MILIWILLIAPLISGIVSLLPSEKLREGFSLAASLTCAVSSTYLLILASKGIIIENWIIIDEYSAIIVFMISSIYFLSSAYSMYFIKRVDTLFLTKRYYYFLLNFFALAMIFTSISNNLGLMWVGLEATTILNALLITLEKKKSGIEAAWRYIIIACAGLGFALFSIIVIYSGANTLNWQNIELTRFTASIAIAFALIGFGTKIGLFPMHTWLPDTYGAAPPQINAMSSAALLPVAMLVYYRILSIAIASHAVIAINLTLFFGVTTALIASLLTIPQKTLKRLFAYSSMDVMGIATIGLALGKYATFASFLLIVIHGFAKAGIFYACGNITTNLHTEKIEDVKSLLNSMKFTAIALIFGSLAVTGAPPFASFIAELVIFVYLFKYPVIAVILAIAILISFLSINYHVTQMTFGDGEQKKISLYAEAIPIFSILMAFVISLIVWAYLEIRL